MMKLSSIILVLLVDNCYSDCKFSQTSLSCSESISSNITFGVDGLPGITTLHLTDMDVGGCEKLIIPYNITVLYATPRQMCRCLCLTSQVTAHNCKKRIKHCINATKQFERSTPESMVVPTTTVAPAKLRPPAASVDQSAIGAPPHQPEPTTEPPTTTTQPARIETVERDPCNGTCKGRAKCEKDRLTNKFGCVCTHRRYFKIVKNGATECKYVHNFCSDKKKYTKCHKNANCSPTQKPDYYICVCKEGYIDVSPNNQRGILCTKRSPKPAATEPDSAGRRIEAPNCTVEHWSTWDECVPDRENCGWGRQKRYRHIWPKNTECEQYFREIEYDMCYSRDCLIPAATTIASLPTTTQPKLRVFSKLFVMDRNNISSVIKLFNITENVVRKLKEMSSKSPSSWDVSDILELCGICFLIVCLLVGKLCSGRGNRIRYNDIVRRLDVQNDDIESRLRYLETGALRGSDLNRATISPRGRLPDDIPLVDLTASTDV